MSDDKPKPLDDLKQGLGFLFRAAKGVAEVAAEKIPSGKLEDAARDAVREVGRALETVGGEIDKAWTKATGATPPPDASAPPSAPTTQGSPGVAPAEDESGGPRVA
jgi:hypothetical protein